MIRGMVETRAAGFWFRALAAALDFGIFALVQASYGALAHLVWSTHVEDAWTLAPMVWTFTVVFAAAYSTVLHALFGQTVGKMIVGVRVVVGEDGVPPSFGASLLRYVAYFVSSATLGLGYVMAALRHDKRALPDLIAGPRGEGVRAKRSPRCRSGARSRHWPRRSTRRRRSTTRGSTSRSTSCSSRTGRGRAGRRRRRCRASSRWPSPMRTWRTGISAAPGRYWRRGGVDCTAGRSGSTSSPSHTPWPTRSPG